MDSPRDNVIATGGGPGLIEAANRGAMEAGAPSIEFNIALIHEALVETPSTAATKIDISLNRLTQLFNSFDPSPFRERDLDREAEDYIVGSAEEARHSSGRSRSLSTCRPIRCRHLDCLICAKLFTTTSPIAATKRAGGCGCYSATAVWHW